MTEVIGVDLGGTKVAVVTLRGRDLGESAIELTQRSGTKALMDQLVRMIEGARSPDLAGSGSVSRRSWSSRPVGSCPR